MSEIERIGKLAFPTTKSQCETNFKVLQSAEDAAKAQGMLDEMLEKFLTAEAEVIRQAADLGIGGRTKLGKLATWVREEGPNLSAIAGKCIEEGLTFYGYYRTYVQEPSVRETLTEKIDRAVKAEREIISNATDSLMNAYRRTGRVDILEETADIPECYREAVDQVFRKRMNKVNGVCVSNSKYVEKHLLTDEERQEALDRKLSHAVDTLSTALSLYNSAPDDKREDMLADSCHYVRDKRTLRGDLLEVIDLIPRISYWLRRAANCDQGHTVPTCARYEDVLTDAERERLVPTFEEMQDAMECVGKAMKRVQEGGLPNVHPTS